MYALLLYLGIGKLLEKTLTRAWNQEIATAEKKSSFDVLVNQHMK